MWDAFGKLTEAVRADGSVLDKHAETPSNAFWETFARSSAALAFPTAAALAELLAPIAAAKKSMRVLDVAAGSGIYGYTQLRAPGVDVEPSTRLDLLVFSQPGVATSLIAAGTDELDDDARDEASERQRRKVVVVRGQEGQANAQARRGACQVASDSL